MPLVPLSTSAVSRLGMEVLYSGNMLAENVDPVESLSVLVLSISDGLLKIAEYGVFSNDLYWVLRCRVGCIKVDRGGIHILCS